MNPVIETPLAPTPPPIPYSINRPVTLADLLRWTRAILGRNPFYILSAVLLLYSMRLLSVDSMASARETPQLLFNFSCFQFYELLLAGTAIFLAGRRIWYDSGLLIGVENLFIFVPFILISQALLLSNAIATELCLAVCALAMWRGWWIKRWLPKANEPIALLIIGAVLLALNVAVPIFTRTLHENVSMRIWDHRGDQINTVEWYWLMPLLMAAAMALPHSAAPLNRDALYTRRFFPFLALTLWIAGTGAHLYCIGYVYGLHWDYRLLVPVVWVLAWNLWVRRTDLDFLPVKYARVTSGILLALPALVLLVAQCAGLGSVMLLAALSAAAYTLVAIFARERLAWHLVCLSMALLMAGLPVKPHYPMPSKARDFDAATIASEFLLGYLVLLTLFSRRPWMGLLGGIMLSTLVMTVFPGTVVSGLAAVQVGLVFALLHGLRWENAAAAIRGCLAVIWAGQSLIWMLAEPSQAERGTFVAGLAVLAGYLYSRGALAIATTRILPWSAAAIMMMTPARAAVIECTQAPTGLLLLLGSFALFGVGTLVAISKNRWTTRIALTQHGVK